MADPLSITASVIAVVGAAEGVGKTLNKIRNFRDAPKELLALINDISDLRIVLGDLESHLTQNAPSIQEEQSEHISTLLNRAKEQLLQLDELVHYRLTRSDSTPQQVKISRQEWAKATSTIKKYRKRLQNTRLNIVAHMLIVNAFVFITHKQCRAKQANSVYRSYQSRISLAVNDIYTLASGPQATENKRTTQRLNEQYGHLTNIINNQSELRGLLQTHLSTRSQDLPRLSTEQLSHSITCIKATVRYQRFPCTWHCGCLCHKPQYFNSPQLVHRVIGTLFLSYSGYPIGMFQRCTLSSCQGQQSSQILVKYLFPSWFLARILVVTFIKRLGSEVHVSLKVQRVVSGGAEIFRLTNSNDVTGLQRLFSKGLASPNDVDYANGQNALAVGSFFLPNPKYLFGPTWK